MKVVENTQDRLVLESHPVRLGIGLAAGVVFLIAASVGLAFDPSIALSILVLAISVILLVPFFLVGSDRTRLVLDNEANTASFERKTLRGWTGPAHSLKSLHCAEIEKQTDRSGTLYRPVVTFKSQAQVDQIALVKTYAAARKAQYAVDAVNKWLERTQQVQN